jgi:hypothetical protein
MIYFIVFYTIFIFITNNFAQIPNNIRIISTDKDFIRLSWSKPDRLTSVYGYTIKYRPVNSNQSWIVRQTNNTQIFLNELRPITKYEIILQAYTNSSYIDSSGPSTRIEATTDETGNVPVPVFPSEESEEQAQDLLHYVKH